MKKKNGVNWTTVTSALDVHQCQGYVTLLDAGCHAERRRMEYVGKLGKLDRKRVRELGGEREWRRWVREYRS